MKNKIVTFSIVLMLICPQFINSISLSKYENLGNSIHLNACPGPFPTDVSIELTTFPIDLDLLFYQDNLTILNYILNDVGNHSTIWPVTPWNGHFHSSHAEGADKWYLYSFRRLPARAIHNGVSKELTIQNGSIINYDSQELVSDTGLTIDIGNDFSVLYGHIDLLKPIYDEIQSSGTYSFIENEIIGYTHNWTSFFTIDFHLMYKYHNICPLEFLSTELRNDLLNYYNLIYERAKISGLYPESKICNNHTIEIENTVWGVWEYNSGFWDEEYYNPDVYPLFGVWTIFNRNFSNSETFYRDEKNPSLNLTDDVIGAFTESIPDEFNGYKKLDQCLIKFVEGDYEVGILEFINHWINDWGPKNTSVFAKFSLAKNGVDPSDDILTLEFFTDLVSAQTGFTNDNLTLARYYHYYTDDLTSPMLGPIAEKVLFFLLGISILTVIIVIPVIIVRRRNRKRKKTFN